MRARVVPLVVDIPVPSVPILEILPLRLKGGPIVEFDGLVPSDKVTVGLGVEVEPVRVTPFPQLPTLSFAKTLK